MSGRGPVATSSLLRSVAWPVLGSRATRAFVLVVGLATALLANWGMDLALSGETHGLSSIFFILFTRLDVRASMWMEIALVLALLVPATLDGDRLARWVGEHVMGIAVAAGLLLALGMHGVTLDHPTAMDEYAQLFQSRIFAAGALYGHFPPDLMDRLVAPGFQNFFLSVSKSTGAVASGYWPSFALLMAPFAAAGLAWVVNPLLSALTLLVTHRLAWRVLGDRQAAGWAVLFTVASPEFFATGLTYYTMAAHLLANGLFALLLLEPTRGRAVLAGVVGSIALTLHNPVPHLLFALPWIAWTASRPGGLRLLGWMALGYLPLSVFLGLGWFVFTNELRAGGLAPVVAGGVAGAASAASAASAAGAGGSLAALHKLVSVFRLPGADLLFARGVGLAKVWLWAMPGLVLLAIAGARRAWRLTAARVLAASALLTLVGYLVVPVDQGHGWGFRYFHPAWIALPVLAAAALPGDEDARRWWWPQGPALRTFVAACAVASLLVVLPSRALQMHEFVADLVGEVPDCATSPGQPRVVLLDAGRMFYGADLVQNDPWLRGDEIRMLSVNERADAAMMAARFPRHRLACHDPRGSVWVVPAGSR